MRCEVYDIVRPSSSPSKGALSDPVKLPSVHVEMFKFATAHRLTTMDGDRGSILLTLGGRPNYLAEHRESIHFGLAGSRMIEGLVLEISRKLS
jgi:hypothetical protein